MARSMDSILSDEPTVHDLPESGDSAPETPQTEKVEAAPDKEKPETAKAGTEKASVETKADGDEEQDHVPDDLQGLKRALAAARGDKRKARKQWQETEKALAELKGRLSATEKPQAQQGQSPAKIDLTDADFVGKGTEAIKEFVERRISADRDERRMERLNLSEVNARANHKDFQEAFDAFNQVAQSNPHMWRQMNDAPDPGEFVYKTGKTLTELQGVDSIDAYRQKVEAEIRAKIEAESTATNHASPVSPPKSIAGARGTGYTATQTWAGPRSMEDVLR